MKKYLKMPNVLAAALLLCLVASVAVADVAWRHPIKSGLTVGDILYAGDTSGLKKLTAGTAGTCLKSGGAATAPAYGECGINASTGESFFVPAIGNCTDSLVATPLIVTRVAASDFALSRTAAGAEVHIIYCNLNSALERVGGTKGVKINSIDIVDQITVANLTTNAWGKLTTRIFGNNAANTISADLSTPPTLNTVVQANPYVKNVVVAVPAYLPAAKNTAIEVEWTATMANTGVYRVYGVSVNYTRLDH